MRTTYMAKPGEVERKWYVIDATGVSLGRLSSEVASILRGKNKPQFTPHIDTGDFVIIINAGKIGLTGKKATDKIYYRHSQYPGGLKSRTAGEMRTNNPEKLLELSIKGMLPKILLDVNYSKNYTYMVDLSTNTQLNNQKYTNYAVN